MQLLWLRILKLERQLVTAWSKHVPLSFFAQSNHRIIGRLQLHRLLKIG